jgi:hypothetical protein
MEAKIYADKDGRASLLEPNFQNVGWLYNQIHVLTPLHSAAKFPKSYLWFVRYVGQPCCVDKHFNALIELGLGNKALSMA